MNQDELKLAETLFIDMVNGDSKLSMNDVEEIALSAHQYASMFYSKMNKAVSDGPIRSKGCPACYGSGGKISQPCKRCHGTGKIVIG